MDRLQQAGQQLEHRLSAGDRQIRKSRSRRRECLGVALLGALLIAFTGAAHDADRHLRHPEKRMLSAAGHEDPSLTGSFLSKTYLAQNLQDKAGVFGRRSRRRSSMLITRSLWRVCATMASAWTARPKITLVKSSRVVSND
eukprot:scaffold213_cov245-Pinguiococcus_pyrenoidosus.AAC.24